MSYRKITVNEKTYEYVVGKTHLKVKGFDAVPKGQVGSSDTYCHCGCGCKICELYGVNIYNHIKIKPSDVRKFILEQL